MSNDASGDSNEFVAYCHAQSVQCSLGFTLVEAKRVVKIKSEPHHAGGGPDEGRG
ncbi:hypothetical protein [Nocardia sp. bgisy118]|uniref:hypothetical protein n=1 Tax=Nocardia sp. bgisy118 TaxID=3413786 RepID=UPI003F49D39F